MDGGQHLQLITKAKLDWLCSFKKHHKGNKVQINQGTEMYEKRCFVGCSKENSRGIYGI